MKHKNFKRLTRAQKILLTNFDARYNPDKWLYKGDSKVNPDHIILIHRETGKELIIPKGGGSK